MTTLPTLSALVIESDRIVLRKARDADREGIIEVMTDPEVRTYLGGPVLARASNNSSTRPGRRAPLRKRAVTSSRTVSRTCSSAPCGWTAVRPAALGT